MGSVAAMALTHSSSGSPSAIMVEMMREVRMERILALTPLPSPSASTSTCESSPCPAVSTWSPHSSSPTWFMLL